MASAGKKSTWQDYVDNTIIGSGFVSKAVICEMEYGKKWAGSPGFDVPSADVKFFVDAFTDPSQLRTTGIMLDEKNYTVLKTELDLITGRSSAGGCVIAKCKQIIVIAVCDDPVHMPNCNALAVKLATFFKDHGY